jgi:hypothetical protein
MLDMPSVGGFLPPVGVGKMRPPPTVDQATDPLVALSTKTQSDFTL